MIDFRSDTVTKPTPEMLEAMFQASVGDDVFEEDPTVNELEKLVANRFGKEAAIFCPSGTMTNQLAIKIHTSPGDEVICAEKAHVYHYEGGGIAFNSGCSTKLIHSENGILSLNQLQGSVRPDDVHAPVSSLLCLENTCNKGGGAVYPKQKIEELVEFATHNKLALHLDGARLFNALVESDYDEIFMGTNFDTISICLSKGLGCPVGSLLIGSTADIKKARRVRKVFGGGMRQVGYLAAAGIYALNNHIERLIDDHQKATLIGNELEAVNGVTKILPVETNIVIAEFESEETAHAFTNTLSESQIAVIKMGSKLVRFVTHLDISSNDLEITLEKIKNISL